MKTGTKIILVLSLVCTLILVIFGSAIYYFLNEYSYIDFYKRLEARVRIYSQYNLKPGSFDSEKLRSLKEQYLEKLEKEKEYLIEIYPGISPDSLSKAHHLPVGFFESLLEIGSARGKKANLFYAGKILKKENQLYLVIVSAENYYVGHHQIFLRNILVGSLVIIALLIIFLSIYFSKQIFVPIQKISDKVRAISTESMHQRLDAEKNNNEISELANTFNDLLNRLETAFETQKNFISNASHELGTPLTAIIGEADVALLKDRSPEEYKKSLNNILFQAERLDQITKSLLFLAQTGYTDKTIQFEILRTDEIIWETKAIIARLNPAGKISVDLSMLPEDPRKLKIKGNKQLLHLAFANILNNACKYSNNKEVTVFIASSDSKIVVSIKDQGIGIPEKEMAFIYDPFFRASNTRLFEGYGIGLPLTRNIIRLHMGQLQVVSKVNEGTTVQIMLPLAYS